MKATLYIYSGTQLTNENHTVYLQWNITDSENHTGHLEWDTIDSENHTTLTEEYNSE